MRFRSFVLVSTLAALALTTPALAQEQLPAGSEAQRAAVADLAFLDGEWRGEARVFNRDGTTTVLTQTERVGPLLGGSIRVVEGRGYDAEGATVFNAMGVLSWDEAGGRYQFRSWANGRSGEYPWARTEDGFVWEVPAGPGAVVRYTATVRDGVWHEAGAYVREGAQPVPFMEMTLRRIGDSPWPTAGVVARQ